MSAPAELLSFPQMVDMIFGTFESGTINLKMLHAFLHALMSQLPLDNVRIRLAGDNLDEVRQKMDRRPKADVKISEYWYNRDEPTVNLVRVKRTKAKDVDKMVVVKQLAEGESDEEVELEESGSMEVLLLGDVNEMQSDHLLALDEILNGAVQTGKSELDMSTSLHLTLLAEHFVNLEQFQRVEEKLTETLESIMLELNGKFNQLQTGLCKIDLELQQLHDRNRELSDFCHENDRRLDINDKDQQLANKRIVCMKHELETHTKEIKRHDEQFDDVQEELNAIKCCKADQEIVDEKADKRDTDRVLKRKVSQITFDSARKHLASDVLAAHEKITRQETIFQQRIMQLSVQVANEREVLEDKCKKSADKITEMCKQLELSLKALHEERAAIETAASAAGFQVGLNCLSCAENSFMTRCEPCVPLAKPFKQHLNQSLRSDDQVERDQPCGVAAVERREKLD